MKLPYEVRKFFERQGKIGAAKRRATLAPERRREIARIAASARWSKPDRCPQFLHDAMRTILAEGPNSSGTLTELSNEIANRGLYVRRDGSCADKHQIAVRARKYPALFEFVDSQTIRLKNPARSSADKSSIGSNK